MKGIRGKTAVALFLVAVGLGAEIPSPEVQFIVTAPLKVQSADFKSNPRFSEVWAYLMAGEENFLTSSLRTTDLAYFGASLNSYGELIGVPKPSSIKNYTGRKHLVLAIQENNALSHMAVFPDFPVRAKLIADLAQAADGFDGVQLDWESITSRDKEHFWSFLGDLKRNLGSKLLSVAVPARTSVVDDAFDYKKLNGLVDRIIVMAYDEHWSGSAPGSVASLDWCQKVAQFALRSIEPAKLVMGAPFYGRAWADRSLSRAYKFSAVAKLMNDKNVPQATRQDGIPTFEYDELVRVRVFFEDKESQFSRLSLYASLGVRNAAFWRLGQEDPETWNNLEVE